MIQVIDLFKSFNDKKVLNGVNLNVESGECIAIIGKSGSGKSVLLKHLLGLLQPDSGEIWIDKKLVHGLSFRDLQKLRSKVGMVFQSGALFDSMTVADNIRMALNRLTDLNKNEIEGRIESCLEQIGMKGTGNLMPAELSGGMKKRVGIARAIAFEPDYLFYDEPTTGLDPIMSDIINKLIVKFQKKKENSLQYTVAIPSHDFNEYQHLITNYIDKKKNLLYVYVFQNQLGYDCPKKSDFVKISLKKDNNQTYNYRKYLNVYKVYDCIQYNEIERYPTYKSKFTNLIEKMKNKREIKDYANILVNFRHY